MKHYVYIHFKKDNLEPFYIGKGIGNRLNRRSSRNKFWHSVVNKHDFVADYLKYFESNKEALRYEIEMIALFRKEGFKLANLTDGGEGTTGITRSNKTRKLLSDLNKGKSMLEVTRKAINKANTGRKHSEETKRKLSEARKGHRLPQEIYDKTAALALGSLSSKYKGDILATNKLSGEVLRLQGEKDIREKGFSPATVYNCIAGRRPHHKGYTFLRDPEFKKETP